MSPGQFKILEAAILEGLRERCEYSDAIFIGELLLAARKACTPEQWKELLSTTGLGRES